MLKPNVEKLDPEPVESNKHGLAFFSIAWDWPEASPIVVGTKFEMLEGEKKIGKGRILHVFFDVE